MHPDGIIRTALVSIGIIPEDVFLLNNMTAVIIVSVYTHLSFAILPIYAASERFDFSLLEAARDLGAGRFRAFCLIYLPGTDFVGISHSLEDNELRDSLLFAAKKAKRKKDGLVIRNSAPFCRYEQISAELNEAQIGKCFKVIIDRMEGEYYVGRTEFDSPEVDPEVLIERGDESLKIGNFYQVEIDSSDDYDLFGHVVC